MDVQATAAPFPRRCPLERQCQDYECDVFNRSEQDIRNAEKSSLVGCFMMIEEV